MEKLFYTSTEFCKAAGISKVTFYKWIKLDGFPVIYCGSKVLIPVKQIEEWISAHIGQNLFPDGVNG